ncbi:hypothetical protein ACOSQ2_006675 [Xanthoceras sorbifolium]
MENIWVADRDSMENKWSSRFHFEEAWIGKPDHRDVVEDAWNVNFGNSRVAVNFGNSGAAGLSSSVGSVSSKLREWNRSKKILKKYRPQ